METNTSIIPTSNNILDVWQESIVENLLQLFDVVELKDYRFSLYIDSQEADRLLEDWEFVDILSFCSNFLWIDINITKKENPLFWDKIRLGIDIDMNQKNWDITKYVYKVLTPYLKRLWFQLLNVALDKLSWLPKDFMDEYSNSFVFNPELNPNFVKYLLYNMESYLCGEKRKLDFMRINSVLIETDESARATVNLVTSLSQMQLKGLEGLYRQVRKNRTSENQWLLMLLDKVNVAIPIKPKENIIASSAKRLRDTLSSPFSKTKALPSGEEEWVETWSIEDNNEEMSSSLWNSNSSFDSWLDSFFHIYKTNSSLDIDNFVNPAYMKYVKWSSLSFDNVFTLKWNVKINIVDYIKDNYSKIWESGYLSLLFDDSFNETRFEFDVSGLDYLWFNQFISKIDWIFKDIYGTKSFNQIDSIADKIISSFDSIKSSNLKFSILKSYLLWEKRFLDERFSWILSKMALIDSDFKRLYHYKSINRITSFKTLNEYIKRIGISINEIWEFVWDWVKQEIQKEIECLFNWTEDKSWINSFKIDDIQVHKLRSYLSINWLEKDYIETNFIKPLLDYLDMRSESLVLWENTMPYYVYLIDLLQNLSNQRDKKFCDYFDSISHTGEIDYKDFEEKLSPLFIWSVDFWSFKSYFQEILKSKLTWNPLDYNSNHYLNIEVYKYIKYILSKNQQKILSLKLAIDKLKIIDFVVNTKEISASIFSQVFWVDKTQEALVKLSLDKLLEGASYISDRLSMLSQLTESLSAKELESLYKKSNVEISAYCSWKFDKIKLPINELLRYILANDNIYDDLFEQEFGVAKKEKDLSKLSYDKLQDIREVLLRRQAIFSRAWLASIDLIKFVSTKNLESFYWWLLSISINKEVDSQAETRIGQLTFESEDMKNIRDWMYGTSKPKSAKVVNEFYEKTPKNLNLQEEIKDKLINNIKKIDKFWWNSWWWYSGPVRW